MNSVSGRSDWSFVIKQEYQFPEVFKIQNSFLDF